MLKDLMKVPPNQVNWRSCKHCFKNEWTLCYIKNVLIAHVFNQMELSLIYFGSLTSWKMNLRQKKKAKTENESQSVSKKGNSQTRNIINSCLLFTARKSLKQTKKDAHIRCSLVTLIRKKLPRYVSWNYIALHNLAAFAFQFHEISSKLSTCFIDPVFKKYLVKNKYICIWKIEDFCSSILYIVNSLVQIMIIQKTHVTHVYKMSLTIARKLWSFGG